MQEKKVNNFVISVFKSEDDLKKNINNIPNDTLAIVQGNVRTDWKENDYTILDDGRIEQWGTTDRNVRGITFPIAFPHKCCNITFMLQGSKSVAPWISNSEITNITNVGFKIERLESDCYIRWRAIGY